MYYLCVERHRICKLSQSLWFPNTNTIVFLTLLSRCTLDYLQAGGHRFCDGKGTIRVIPQRKDVFPIRNVPESDLSEAVHVPANARSFDPDPHPLTDERTPVGWIQADYQVITFKVRLVEPRCEVHQMATSSQSKRSPRSVFTQPCECNP